MDFDCLQQCNIDTSDKEGLFMFRLFVLILFCCTASAQIDQLLGGFQNIVNVVEKAAQKQEAFNLLLKRAGWIKYKQARNFFMIHDNITGERGDTEAGKMVIGKEFVTVTINFLVGVESIYQDCTQKQPKVDCSDKKADLDNFKRRLTGHYKIHLMPQPDEILPVMEILMKAIESDPSIGELISEWKVRADLQVSYDKNKQVLPLIVIYPAEGQDNVQKLLDKLMVLFNNFKGSGIVPRYNLKVNDLIFYAQSDADYKPDNLEYFDKDKNYALYKPDFQGSIHDYTLKF